MHSIAFCLSVVVRGMPKKSSMRNSHSIVLNIRDGLAESIHIPRGFCDRECFVKPSIFISEAWLCHRKTTENRIFTILPIRALCHAPNVVVPILYRSGAAGSGTPPVQRLNLLHQNPANTLVQNTILHMHTPTAKSHSGAAHHLFE